MADIVSPERRSKNMSAIKSKDTKPEIYFRKKLFSLGYRYRKHNPKIYGHPDIYIARKRTAVFINGCFWHRHQNCKFAYVPKSRIEFWDNKFEANMQRDVTVRKELFSQSIKCLVVWECTIKHMLKDKAFEEKIIQQTVNFLNSDEMYQQL